MSRSARLLVVRNVTRNMEIGRSIREARSMWSRGRGLMFAAGLSEGEGLLIDPCSSIHMFFMRFPLDVLYVSRDHKVVRVQRNIRPWRVGPIHTSGARYVIELPVGAIDASGTQVGDQLSLSPADSPEAAVE